MSGQNRIFHKWIAICSTSDLRKLWACAVPGARPVPAAYPVPLRRRSMTRSPYCESDLLGDIDHAEPSSHFYRVVGIRGDGTRIIVAMRLSLIDAQWRCRVIEDAQIFESVEMEDDFS
jgi:hypothetical protein